MLIQLDGSHHARLEDRGPKFALLLAVDDATSAVVNAVFKHNARQPETAAEGHPVLPLVAGTGDPADLRPLSPSQGPCGTRDGDFPGPAVPRQLLLPNPVASLGNVTETLAPGIRSHQGQFRHGRELGTARNTVRKYVHAEKPPTKKLSAKEQDKLRSLRKTATVTS